MHNQGSGLHGPTQVFRKHTNKQADDKQEGRKNRLPAAATSTHHHVLLAQRQLMGTVDLPKEEQEEGHKASYANAHTCTHTHKHTCTHTCTHTHASEPWC